MSTQGEDITKDRIAFQKSNKALGYIYKEWYEIKLVETYKIKEMKRRICINISFNDYIFRLSQIYHFQKFYYFKSISSNLKVFLSKIDAL